MAQTKLQYTNIDSATPLQLSNLRVNEAVAVTSTSTELNRLDGISANVTATNLNTLTAGGSSDADALHTHPAITMVTDTIVFNRDASTASGAVLYNHSLGRVPKQIIFNVVRPTSSNVGESHGSYSSTSNANKCVYVPYDTGNTSTNSGNCIVISNAAGSASNIAPVTSANATTFTLTWTKTGSPTGTYNIVAHLIA